MFSSHQAVTSRPYPDPEQVTMVVSGDAAQQKKEAVAVQVRHPELGGLLGVQVEAPSQSPGTVA